MSGYTESRQGYFSRCFPERFIEGFLYCCIAFVPVAVYPYGMPLAPYNKYSVKLILPLAGTLLSLLLVGVYWLRNGRIKFKYTPINTVLILYLGIAAASTVFSAYRYASIRELTAIGTYSALFFLTANYIDSCRKLKTASLIWTAAVLVVVSIGTGEFLKGKQLGATFGNWNFLAAYLALSLPLMISLFIYYLLQWRRYQEARLFLLSLISLSISGILLVLIAARSRGAWVGLAGGGIGFFLILVPRNKRYRAALCVMVAIILILAVSGGVPLLLKQFYGDVRLPLWSGVLDMISQRPITGYGLGTFFIYYPEFRQWEYFLSPKAVDTTRHAHNEYMEIIAETGVIGLSIYLLILVIFFREAMLLYDRLRHYKRGEAFILGGLIAGSMSLLVHNIVDVNLRFPSSAIPLWMSMGMVMGIYRARKKMYYSVRETAWWAGFRGKTIIALFLSIITLLAACRLILKPYISDVYFKKARELRKEEDYHGAIAMYKRALDFDPDRPRVLYRLGYAYERIDELEQAIDTYRAVKRLAPHFASVDMNLGELFLRKGFLSQAEKQYVKALQLNPYSGDAHNNRAFILRQRGEDTKARYEILRARDLYLRYGDLYFREEQYDRAIAEYQKAHFITKGDVAAAEKLSDAYFKLGRIHEALEVWNTVRANVADSPVVREKIETLKKAVQVE